MPVTVLFASPLAPETPVAVTARTTRALLPEANRTLAHLGFPHAIQLYDLNKCLSVKCRENNVLSKRQRLLLTFVHSTVRTPAASSSSTITSTNSLPADEPHHDHHHCAQESGSAVANV